jgi:uncharacterized protein (TIGR03118 family)
MMFINQLLTFFTQPNARRNAGKNKRCPAAAPPRRKTLLHAEALEPRMLMATAPLNSYQQTNLISDQAGVAPIQDSHLTNAWGLAAAPGDNFLIGDNGSGVASVYSGDVLHSPLTKALADISVPGGHVTAVAVNQTGAFSISDGNGHSAPATYLFATEDGRIAGWNAAIPPPGPSTTAETGITLLASDYKGIAVANNAGQNLIYAANFFSGGIDIFNTHFAPASVSGHFTDANLPVGYAPYNIENINGVLFVAYAKQDITGHDAVAGAGKGFVDAFNSNGNLLMRLSGGTALNAPWGIARAPVTFGPFGGDILVGNFGDGHIHAFNPSSGALVGTLDDSSGNAIAIDGLWGLAFGNGSTAGDLSSLYFTSGPNSEAHGLFGKLTVAPQILNQVSITGLTVHGTKTAGLFTGAIRISNKSGKTVSGNINLVFDNLPPGVTILNATGKTASGVPFLTIPTSIRGHHSIRVRIAFTGSWSIMPATKTALHHPTVLLGTVV